MHEYSYHNPLQGVQPAKANYMFLWCGGGGGFTSRGLQPQRNYLPIKPGGTFTVHNNTRICGLAPRKMLRLRSLSTRLLIFPRASLPQRCKPRHEQRQMPTQPHRNTAEQIVAKLPQQYFDATERESETYENNFEAPPTTPTTTQPHWLPETERETQDMRVICLSVVFE